MNRKLLVTLVLFALMLVGCRKDDSSTNPSPEPSGRQHDIAWPSLASSPWPMNHGNPQSTGRSKLPGPTRGLLLWDKGPIEWSQSAVAVTRDSLLITGFHLTAIDFQDSVRWTSNLNTPGDQIVTTPVITSDGTIIAASLAGRVYTLNSNGSAKWSLDLGEPVYQQGT
jgi:outer membrane protein assembly factor BamB